MKPELEQGTFGIFPSELAKDCECNEQVVLAWLWKHKNESGTCFPSLNRLCILCHLSKPTVIKALTSLEGRGLIAKGKQFAEDGGYARNIYTVYIRPVNTLPSPSNSSLQGGEGGASKGNGSTLVSQVDTNYTNITIPSIQPQVQVGQSPSEPSAVELPKAEDSKESKDSLYKKCKPCIDALYAHKGGYPAIPRSLKALAAPIRDFGPQEVYDRLLRYLKSTKPSYASFEHFKANFGQFENRRPVMPYVNPYDLLPGEKGYVPPS